MNSIILNLIRLSCPKCHLSVSHDSSDQNDRETCKNCGHSFDWRKRLNEHITQLANKKFSFGGRDEIDLGRDVYVGGKFNDVSIGAESCGGVHVGKISGDSFDNLVRDHNGFIQGKITASGHFTDHCV